MIPFKRYHRIGLVSTVQSTTVEMRSILYNWSSITEILALHARVQSEILNYHTPPCVEVHVEFCVAKRGLW